MTPFWVARGIKGALGMNRSHDLSGINIADGDLNAGRKTGSFGRR